MEGEASEAAKAWEGVVTVEGEIQVVEVVWEVVMEVTTDGET